MSVFFISDLHLSHRGMWKNGWSSRQTWIDSYETHDAHLRDLYCSVVKSNKRDVCWFLGDIAFTTESLCFLEHWPGRKILVRGNHDKLNEGLYRRVFEKIYGVVSYQNMWMSHIPVHPNEIRRLGNVHGHLHDDLIRDHYHIADPRYINVGVEHLKGVPMHLDQLRAEIERRGLTDTRPHYKD